MTDLIKKATSRIDKIDKDWNHLHENYLDELKNLKNKYDDSFVEAFDQELYPRIKYRMMDTIKASFATSRQDPGRLYHLKIVRKNVRRNT